MSGPSRGSGFCIDRLDHKLVCQDVKRDRRNNILGDFGLNAFRGQYFHTEVGRLFGAEHPVGFSKWTDVSFLNHFTLCPVGHDVLGQRRFGVDVQCSGSQFAVIRRDLCLRIPLPLVALRIESLKGNKSVVDILSVS